MMRPMQAQPTPVEFIPQEHTDFIFAVPSWPAFLVTVGATAFALTAIVVFFRRRRRRRAEP